MGDPSLPPCHPAAVPPLAPSASSYPSMPGTQELALGNVWESSASPLRVLSPEVVANGSEGEAAFEGASERGAAQFGGAPWQHDGGAGTLAASMQQCRLSAAGPASVRGAAPSPASPSCSRASPLGLHACPPPLPSSSPAAPPCPQPAQPRGQAAHRSLLHGQRLSHHSHRQATSPHHSRPACVLQRWQVPPRSTARWGRGMHRPPHSAPFSPASYVLGAHAAARGGVALCLSPQGRRNGEALIRFVSPEHRDMALKRHKHHIGNRYIEVYKATGEDFINVAGGSNNEAQQFLSRGGQVIIRMRGLPYDCTPKQVVEFFESGENGCHILDNEDGVLFVRKPDGRATGDAFVLFASEDDSSKALAKHREIIGSRYIELFRSTTAEVQQVLNRSMDPRTYEQQQPLIAQLPQVPLLPQQIITSGTRKDCIRLRGLPFEAQVEHILEFLGEHAKSIVYQGVHMVYNAHGQPSGEAFIQMDSEHSAFLASQQRHHRYMVFGKKQRYIEVFQCSGEDMNMVLTGGLPTQRPVMSPGGTVVAPPFGAFPLGPAPVLSAVGAVTPRLPAYPGMAYPTMFYWPYPSPPVSPSSPYYSSPPHLATPATPPHHTIIAQECIPIQANGDAARHNGEAVATM